MAKPARVLVADLPRPLQDTLRIEGRVSLRLLGGGLAELEPQDGPPLVRVRRDPSALFGRIRAREALTDDLIEAGIGAGATEGW